MPNTVALYLLDVEGTTTPIDFVHRTLFGYAKRVMSKFLASYAEDGNLLVKLAELREEYQRDRIGGLVKDLWSNSDRPEDALTYIQWLISVDRKSPQLKWIQGKIWQEGYVSGELKGEVFPDVPIALERWSHSGIATAIYSSGSVLAQRLLFGYSTAGDLTSYIDAYFDTAVGGKRDSESYKNIAEVLDVPPQEILFVSDVAEELAAAREAGMQIVLSIRPGNAPVAGEFRRIESFDELD
ncbi:MAG: acireductone synthase [bacterium]|nr:acireductone synthase [bacterium]